MAKRVTWQKRAISLAKVLWGSLLAPLSNTAEFIRGGVIFLWTVARGKPYTYKAMPVSDQKTILDKKDPVARIIPFTLGLGRTGGVVATTLCILGFLAVVAIPIPGIAPIYVLSVAALAKASGITLLSTFVGRTTGALVGSIIDSRYALHDAER